MSILPSSSPLNQEITGSPALKKVMGERERGREGRMEKWVESETEGERDREKPEKEERERNCGEG